MADKSSLLAYSSCLGATKGWKEAGKTCEPWGTQRVAWRFSKVTGPAAGSTLSTGSGGFVPGWALMVWIAGSTVVLVSFVHIANTTTVYGNAFTCVERCTHFYWMYFEPTNEKTFIFTDFSYSAPLVSPALVSCQGVSSDGHMPHALMACGHGA